jgi:hypothetical protein
LISDFSADSDTRSQTIAGDKADVLTCGKLTLPKRFSLRECIVAKVNSRGWLASPALVLLISGCSALPAKFPESSPQADLVAINDTRVRVKDQFKYAPTLTTIVLPEGEYVPVKSDGSGTYYQSPRGVLVIPIAGAQFIVAGGIFRSVNPTLTYPFSVYGSLSVEPLHNMLGLNLNDKIECTPACQFK